MSNNLQPGARPSDVDATVQDSIDQRPCDVCGEDPGNCVCDNGALDEPVWCEHCGAHEITDACGLSCHARHSDGCPNAEMPALAPITRRCATLTAPEFAGCCDEPSGPPPTRIDVTAADIRTSASAGELINDAVYALFEHSDRIEILAPGEWREQLESEREQSAANHDEWSRDFAAELQGGYEDE